MCHTDTQGQITPHGRDSENSHRQSLHVNTVAFWQNDQEVVSSNSSYESAVGCSLLQVPRNCYQGIVAVRMAEAVVEDTEIINIYKQNPMPTAGTLSGSAETTAIEKARKWVNVW